MFVICFLSNLIDKLNWGALDFALGWIRGKGRASGEQSRDGGSDRRRQCSLDFQVCLREKVCLWQYCDRVKCVCLHVLNWSGRCVCVCECLCALWLEKMVLLLVPVRERENREGVSRPLQVYLSLFTGPASQSATSPRRLHWARM